MDDKDNLSVCVSRKLRSPQLTRKINQSSSVFPSGFKNEILKKTNSTIPKNTERKEGFKIDISSKTEELKDRRKKNENSSHNPLPKRPSTASGGTRKKMCLEEREESLSPLSCKSFSLPSKSSGPERESNEKERTQSPTKTKTKDSVKENYKIEFTEDFRSASLLSLAVFEQERIIETLSAAREELRKKMAEKVKSKSVTNVKFPGDCKSAREPPPDSNTFDDIYRNTLEEIFQVWVHLFYFIINLRVKLVRVFEAAATEPFTPKVDMEKDVVTQAIECVKFFTRLKMKSMENSLEGLWLPIEQNASETQISNCEERVSALFFSEMDFIQKKTKEMLIKANDEKEKNSSE